MYGQIRVKRYRLVQVEDGLGHVFVVSQSGHQGFWFVIVLLDQRLPGDVIFTLTATQDLHSGRVEAHVVDPPAGRVAPAVAQPLPERLVGDVQADHQVQLAQAVHLPGLGQSAGETWRETEGHWFFFSPVDTLCARSRADRLSYLCWPLCSPGGSGRWTDTAGRSFAQSSWISFLSLIPADP
ncbi:hypothetical protein EYF80_054983 [Liparis tanakae]|uniref:Uncharacterized protein n=1 Tax=Liparis tanakae TaxID=230148 RepID=A0A4Z2F1E7_9TELE|nr:hypothetical protein EYF80_054983 [Liparis tanakae]